MENDRCIQIGNIMKGISSWENPSVGRVYDTSHLAPTINSGGVAADNHILLWRC